MKAFHAGALVTVAAVFWFLGSAAISRAKDRPIEILHLQRFYVSAPARVAFEVRLKPSPTDRHVSAFVCDLAWELPCGLKPEEHDDGDSHDIEGDQSAKLWRPARPFVLGPGEFVIVAAIGPPGQIRAADAQRVSVIAP